MLDDVRVLDCTGVSGAFAGKILGDLGADVVRVEPPGGDPARAHGPFFGGPGPEHALPWLAANTSKRSVVIDRTDAEGEHAFRRLLAAADVLLATGRPSELVAQGLHPEALAAEFPRLVACAITPFGLTGPWAERRGGDLVVVASGGNAHLTGPPDRPPVRCSLPTAFHHAGPEAALAVVLALHARAHSGRGGVVDVSLHETQLQTLLSFPAQFPLHHRRSRRSGAYMARLREIWPCADGYVSYGLRGGPTRVRNLAATAEWMRECGELPAWLEGYDWKTYNHNTLDEAQIARLEQAFGAFFRTRRMADLYAEALVRRVLLAPCNDAAALAHHPQLESREFFCSVEGPPGQAPLRLPAGFAKTPDAAIRVRRRAPRIGEHGDEVLAQWHPHPALPPAPASAGAARPVLEGLRILELGSGAAGPVATRYLVEHGAVVIRIESRRAPDFLRVLWLTPGDPHGLDGSPMFALLNPDKQSLAVDLKQPEGLALVRRLALEWADVVSENFAPGPMEKWGLTPDVLLREKPSLVMVSACLFGQTGPQRHYPGFGGQGSALSGYNHLTGWPDREAHGPAHTITDSLSPRFVALAIVAALWERRRTGRGRAIDLSQIEAAVYALSEAIARYDANGEVMTRCGNRDALASPHGIYPTRPDARGDDRWIAICVQDDAAWRAFAALPDAPEWAREPALAAVAARRARADALDAQLADWTRVQDAAALAERLQQAGLEAGVVQSEEDLLDDPQLAHRGHWVPVLHPLLGELLVERAGFRLGGAPAGFRRPGPLLGEHGEEILRSVLGLDEPALRALRESEVLT